MIAGSRQDELLARSSLRTVTAMIYMQAPSKGASVMDGMIMEGKPTARKLSASEAFVESAHVWKHDDTCKPKIATDPLEMTRVLDAMRERARRARSGEFEDIQTARTVFDSSDLVDRAAGVPPQLSLTFSRSSEGTALEIMKVPFAKLQAYLMTLHEKLAEAGGRLHSVDVAHVPAMTAYEFYEQQGDRIHPGNKFRYGDLMLAKAHNLLRDIALHRVESAAKPRLN